MAGFRFQLTTVLKHRERLEHDRQRDLALAQAEQFKIQEQIRQLDQSMQKSTQDLRDNHLVGTINLAYLTAHRRFTLSVQRQGIALLNELKQHDAKVNLARAALAQATSERKIIEKLREKQLARWNETQARKEAADLDEVAMQMSFDQQLEQDVATPTGGDEVPS